LERHEHGIAEQGHWSEQPPRFSVRGRAGIRTRLVRSTVPVGGCRSVLALGGRSCALGASQQNKMATEIPTSRARAERQEDKKTTRALDDWSVAGEGGAGDPAQSVRGLRFLGCLLFTPRPPRTRRGCWMAAGSSSVSGHSDVLQMRHRESEIECLTRALERTAAPLCRDDGLGDSEVAGFGERRGRAAVAQLGR
jgi:hypothetical protein